MQPLKDYFQKILSLLRVRSRVDGLEISDQVLRLTYLDGGVWQMESVVLMPGVMEKGKIKDAEAFAAALRELRGKLPLGKAEKKKVNVFAALSSVNMYSQVFTLPFMEGEDLSKAIALNIQMVSPVDIKSVYSGWQLLERDEKNLHSEIAVAFADKMLVDEITQALYAAGFIAVGVESRALALVRALREKSAGMDAEGSYLMVDIDNAGIDFLIIRKGKLYFEYSNGWTDIADEKGQVSIVAFEELLVTSGRQVMNFYSQHWPEPLAGIVLSAVAFEEQAEEAIRNFSAVPIIPLSLSMDQQIPPEWLVAFGCGLRGDHTDKNDKEITLSGSGAMDAFYEERTIDFLAFWRVLVPVTLIGLVVVSAGADNFLWMTKASIESSSAFTGQGSGSADIAALEASSTVFNQSLALIANAESQINHSDLMITDINAIAAANSVTVNNISFQAMNVPILVAGSASSADQISAFKNAIQSDPHFGPVTLPLLNIQGNSGAYTFSMTFPLLSSNF